MFVSLLLAVALVFTSTVPALAFTDGENKTSYDFSVKTDSDEWKSFTTKTQRVDACQIPDNILKNMSTEDLLDTVLNYPLMNSFLAFNSVEDAYKVIYNDFNGLRELMDRNDATDVILEKYENTNVVRSVQADTASSKSFFLPSTLEFIIACDQLNNGFTPQEQDSISQIIEEKNAEREAESIYSTFNNVYSNFEEAAPSEQEQLISRASEPGSVWTEVKGKVKTPKGSKVSGVYKRSPDFTSAEKSNLKKEVKNMFPNTVFVSDATVKYNCHSYAWYKQSTSNPYWINDAPDIYIDDGSYKLSTERRPRVGFKAYYNSGEHSGVVQEIKVVDGAQTFLIQSKWGQLGLYKHSPYDSPYTQSIDFYMKSAN